MSIFDITGILARKTRRPTGRISDLQKAYPTYFDPSKSNGEVNFIKQQPQHIQFHHLSSKLQTEIKHSPSVGSEKFFRAFAAHDSLYKTPQKISEKEAGGDEAERF